MLQLPDSFLPENTIPGAHHQPQHQHHNHQPAVTIRIEFPSHPIKLLHSQHVPGSPQHRSRKYLPYHTLIIVNNFEWKCVSQCSQFLSKRKYLKCWASVTDTTRALSGRKWPMKPGNQFQGIFQLKYRKMFKENKPVSNIYFENLCTVLLNGREKYSWAWHTYVFGSRLTNNCCTFFGFLLVNQILIN